MFFIFSRYLVEEHFVQQALESQIFLLEQLPKLFQDNIHIFVTSCTLNILSQMGNHYSGALKICQSLIIFILIYLTFL